ncbi:hypothetical protein P4J24_21580 [Bacillus anthracis]|nr:hypothetical protein [Bacillus thuringiensis]MEB9684471.1 hypothetical protein [Bacillus anthracis]
MTNMYHSLLFMAFYDLGLDNEIKFDKRYILKHLLILKEVNMNYISSKEEMLKAKRWSKDMIAAGRGHTVALKCDNTVEATGWRRTIGLKPDGTVIAVGCVHTVGLKSDGTVVAECYNTYGQCDVSSWRNIRLPSK